MFATEDLSLKARALVPVMLLAGTLLAGAQQSNVVIESIRLPGQITFAQISNSASYEVESSYDLFGTWTSIWSTVAPPPGVVTASVPLLVTSQYFRVLAWVTNGTPPVVAPTGMVLIPSGSYVLGSATNVFPYSEAFSDELPQHTVDVSSFYMDVCEVSKALWDEVKAYSATNGYTYSNPGGGKATNHPVHSVNWFDVVKWCNARSQKEGFAPVYYADAGFTSVYKTGESTPFANWSTNGYRLPTEAEWEKAARGGASDVRFPWTDYTNNISWTKANYYGSTLYSYDVSGGSGSYHPTFATGGTPYTSPVGYFAPNGYGLYDMAGNVWEWCWDWYSGSYYSSSPGTDPRGPTGPLTYRVMRGGSWLSYAVYARVSCRSFYAYPDILNPTCIGFRCVRGL